MSATAIPVEAKEEALRIIARFNQEVLADSECRYVPRFKGKFLYLDREDSGSVELITSCKLAYARSETFAHSRPSLRAAKPISRR